MNASVRRAARSLGLAINGNPAVRSVKNLRNRIIDHGFRRSDRAEGLAFAGRLESAGIRDAAFTIAFNCPWAIDLLTRSWEVHQPRLPLVVVDNSSDASARAAHAETCGRRGVRYIGLPPNPEWSPNRSHGIALNWVWFNVVRPAGLELAGFIDHDLIPVAAFDLRRATRGRAAYGLRGASLTHPQAWNLWAGYCFVRPAAAEAFEVDFKHRIEHGLDTGGGNWRGFYRWLGDESVGSAANRWERLDLGDGGLSEKMLLLDGAFLHLDGASYRSALQDESSRRRLVEAVLARSATAAADDRLKAGSEAS